MLPDLMVGPIEILVLTVICAPVILGLIVLTVLLTRGRRASRPHRDGPPRST